MLTSNEGSGRMPANYGILSTCYTGVGLPDPCQLAMAPGDSHYHLMGCLPSLFPAAEESE